jgi:hypothetical protein
LRVKKAGGEEYCGDGKTAEMSEEAGADSHENAPCVKTKMLLRSCA